jgi:CNT family concentrative nucleoside transporter
MPETATPVTAGTVQTQQEKSPYVNGIDAATGGTTVGLKLALNVAAMLIVFIAFKEMFDAILGGIKPALLWTCVKLHASSAWVPEWLTGLSLAKLFGWIFSPAAFLMGVEPKDVSSVGTLLGDKLAVNEHFAYLVMKDWKALPDFMTTRSYTLAAFALTGFANFASVGIQLGGIGAIAPERRHDLARLGLRDPGTRSPLDGKLDSEGLIAFRIWTVLEQPIGQTRLNIFQCEIVQQVHQVA